MIERVPVQSSNVVSAGYDRASQTLEVEFRTGVYRIEGFPEGEWRAFMAAPSVGSYYQQSIRPHYAAALIDPDAGEEPDPEVEPEPDPEPGPEAVVYHCPNCGKPTVPMGHLDTERNVYTCERRRGQ